jgi:hypothetical protein
MSRRDDYLDAMLRHLGAAYYESVHGRAARSDVARALDTVEAHLNERRRSPARSLLITDGGMAGGPAESAT